MKKSLLIITFILLGSVNTFAYITEIPSFTSFENRSEFIVKGLVSSVKDGKEISKDENPRKIDLIEQIYLFQVTSSLKGDIKKNTTIQIIIPAINWKKVNGVMGGPFFCYLKQGDLCMVGLNFYDFTHHEIYRIAGNDIYADTENMKYPVAAANLYNDAPEGTPQEKIVWEFYQGIEKGTIAEALVANGQLFGMGDSPEIRKYHPHLIEYSKKADEAKKGIVTVALCNSGDTTLLPDIIQLVESNDTVAFSAAVQCLERFSTPAVKDILFKQYIKGLSSKDVSTHENSLLKIVNEYKTPEAVDIVVKMCAKPHFDNQNDIVYAVEKMRDQMTPAQKEEIKNKCLDILQENDNRDKENAIWILRWIGDKSVLPVLGQFLDNDTTKGIEGTTKSDAFLRRDALVAIHFIGGKDAIPIIAKGLYFPDYYTRDLTVLYLWTLTGEGFGFNLEHKASPEEQDKIVQQYIQWWETEGKEQYTN